MEDNKNSQIKLKEIPVFTVLKSNSILKNIFLLHNKQSSTNQDSDEQILIVGRHPNCNIILEHPSISRYHLRIHSNPSTRSLSVYDLSSVHGTWVSGKKIEPEVHVELKEGDTMKLGGSSRVYELHWVPVSRAYDDDGQFMSTMYTIKEGEEEMHQDEKLNNHMSDNELDRSELSSSDMIHHDSPVRKLDLFTSFDPDRLTSSCDDSDGVNASKIQSFWSNDNKRSESKMLNLETDKDGMLFCDDTVLIQPTLNVSETISSIEDSVSLHKSEDELNCLLSESEDDMNWLRDNLKNESELQNHGIINNDPFSVPNCSKSLCDDYSPVKILNLLTFSDPDCLTSSCDDTKVECTSPPKTGTVSGTQDSDGLNTSEIHSNLSSDNMTDELKIANQETHPLPNCSNLSCDNTALCQPPLVSEDELNWLMDNLSNEFEMQNDESIKEDPISVLNFPSSESSEDGFDWLRDNLASESDLEYNGIVNNDPFSVLNCSKSLCADTELEQLSPRNTHTENITVESAVTVVVIDGADIGNKLESIDHEIIKEDVNSLIVNDENNNNSFSKQLLTGVDESYSAFVHRSLNDVEKVDSFVSSEEPLFSSSEKEIKSRQLKTEGSCNPQTVQNVIDSSHGGTKKRWTMVVDASSLLHVESFKHLKLLEGLKGTQIVIPKIVTRELMDIQSQDNNSILKRNTEKVSLALKWIDECVARTKWWIHMDDDIILSSELKSEVLETAIRLRNEITDRKIIIVSNDLTLKIKAMAQGIMCEEAEEFRRSLVNPFSDRFMWVGSIARGLSWSSLNDDILRQKFYARGLNGSQGLKGLKLLAHDISFC